KKLSQGSSSSSSKCNNNEDNVNEKQINKRSMKKFSNKHKGWAGKMSFHLMKKRPRVIRLHQLLSSNPKAGDSCDEIVETLADATKPIVKETVGLQQSNESGSSGGILTVWDNIRFLDTKAMGEEGFLVVVGSWKARDGIVGKTMLNGLMIDGTWCEDPVAIKAKVVDFYKNIFAENESSRPVILNNNFKKISSEEKGELEQDVEEEEVWNAINFVVANRLQNKKVIHKVVGEEQNGFIQGRYILDGALIANEAVQGKWCKWIEACQTLTSISVLVSGSPTPEFKMKRRVRQDDPLSPFLYLVAAGEFNVTIKEVVSCEYFIGVKIGSSAIPVSHLQYVDDTLIFGEWKESNARNLMRIMKCVKQASGLKINSEKTK
nr:cysteine-rich receptor-like protein kinase [Tanacetum cinerariifolium]